MFKLGKINRRTILDWITLGGLLIGLLALFALIYYQVRPLQLADIKVPVATDKSSYYPGQKIGGIFFGETFYDGNVKILREVFCTDYKGVIKPPAEAADGNFFDTQAKPRKLEGNTIPIGTLPDDVPLRSNCIIRFTNVYLINTPFGVRREPYEYYTQNFAIISKERNDQLDCEATGKSTEKCLNLSDKEKVVVEQNSSTQSNDNTFGGGTFNGGGASAPTSGDKTTVNNTDNSTTINNPPAEPVQPPQACTVDLLGVKLFCD